MKYKKYYKQPTGLNVVFHKLDGFEQMVFHRIRRDA